MYATERKGMLLLLTIAAVLLGLAGAQTTPPPAGVAAVAGEESVLLRWALPGQVFPNGGFVVTRSGGGEDLTFAVPSPMPRDAALAAGLVNGDEYDFLEAVFGTAALGGPSSEGDAAFARAIAALTTVARPDYARVTGTLFEDSRVVAGATYSYTVSTAAGREVGTVQVTAGEAGQLPAIDGVSGTVAEGRVELTWQRPAEEALIAAYNVYREHEGNSVLLTEDPFFIPIDMGQSQPLFSDPGVTPGNRYSYRIEGIDLFGRAAPLSDPVTVVVPDPNPLAVPQIENSVAGDLEITIEWSPPTDERVRAVGVRRYTDPEGEFELITPRFLPVSTTSFTDSDVLGGQNYYYTLVSVDGAGRISEESTMWAQRGYNPTPPSAPVDVAVIETEEGLTLDWQAPPERDVASYRIYASRTGDRPVEEFNFVDLTTTTSYRVEMLEGTLEELHLSVSAVNSSDVEGPRSPVVSGQMVDTTPPPAPSLVDVIGEQGAITVVWAASASSDVSTLRLYRSVTGSPAELLADGLEPAAGRFEDDSVQAGAEYVYSLAAVDGSGNESARSQTMSTRAFDFAPPGAVSDVVATVGDEGVQLAWDAQEGASYVVERARVGSSEFVEISDRLSDSGFLDARGAAGDSYRVFAISAGGIPGEVSATVIAGD